MLSHRPVLVSQLAKPLGLTLTAVEVLEACGLVVTERVGRVRICRMDSASLDTMERWIRGHRSKLGTDGPIGRDAGKGK